MAKIHPLKNWELSHVQWKHDQFLIGNYIFQQVHFPHWHLSGLSWILVQGPEGALGRVLPSAHGKTPLLYIAPGMSFKKHELGRIFLGFMDDDDDDDDNDNDAGGDDAGGGLSLMVASKVQNRSGCLVR